MVDKVIQHHQGAGDPSDAALAEVAPAGYSYGIGGSASPSGATTWRRFRSPSQDFSTSGANHVSAGVVLTGDRNVHPVSAADLAAMREIAADMRARGELTPAPYVIPHREMPFPNRTICPGNHVAYVDPPRFPDGNNLVWVAIVAAYHEKQVPPMPKTQPQFFPPLDDVAAADSFGPNGQYVVLVSADGHVYCPNGGYVGGPYDDDTGHAKPYWLVNGVPRSAAGVIGRADGYTIHTTDQPAHGPGYSYPDQ